MLGFARTNRLVSKQDFQSVFAGARRLKRQFLLALYQPNQHAHARLGLIIAKHHVKTAVNRNWLRRMMRERFRANQESLKGLDIIVLMRSSWTPTTTKRMLREDIDNLWHALITSSPKA